MNRGGDTKVSIAFIVVSVIVNFVNYALFYNVIHPSWFLIEFSALAMFIAGTLGITIFPAGVAAIIAAFFMIPKKHKHRYLYYFGIVFLILSLLSVVVSVSNAWYAQQFLP
jgi:hypothetical protein